MGSERRESASEQRQTINANTPEGLLQELVHLLGVTRRPHGRPPWGDEAHEHTVGMTGDDVQHLVRGNEPDLCSIRVDRRT